MAARSLFGLKLLAVGLFAVAGVSHATLAVAANRVCSPASMLKVVTSLDVPGTPQGHFGRVPKTLYRYGDVFGRVEESLNPETGLHLLVVVAEPHIWVVDQATGKGKHQRDPGPTYVFRAKIFGDPSVQSAFINSLEFGCEAAWLIEAGAAETRVNDPRFGLVDRLEYRQGTETLHLYMRAGRPARLELRRAGELYVAVQYVQYQSDLPLNRSLFEQPAGIRFVEEMR